MCLRSRRSSTPSSETSPTAAGACPLAQPTLRPTPRALVTTDYIEDSAARETLLANVQAYKFEFLNKYLNYITQPLPAGPKPKQSDILEHQIRVQCLYSAQRAIQPKEPPWALGPQPCCIHDAEEILRPTYHYDPIVEMGNHQPKYAIRYPTRCAEGFTSVFDPRRNQQ